MSNIRPIIILGAARSGTTLLAEKLLSCHPAVAYWNEPAFIWKAGFSYRSDDLIGVQEISDGYVHFVQRKFKAWMKDTAAGTRFMEKTPSNCLRVDAIAKIFPRAQFIHVIRDGRAVALSAAKEWAGISSDSLDSVALRKKMLIPRLLATLRTESTICQRFTNWRTILDLPAYFIRFIQTVLRQVFHPTSLLWGPRIPGLRQIRRSFSLIETCAIQWEVCVRAAKSSGYNLDSSQYLEVRYEDLLNNPMHELKRIIEFLGLEPFPQEVLQSFSAVVSNRGDLWKERYGAQDLVLVENRIGLTLEELGYVKSCK